MKESRLSKLISWVVKYIKILNFALGFFAGIFIINKYGWNFILNWKIEYNQVLIDYLKVVLNYPFILFLIFVLFVFNFGPAFDFFIRNMHLKYKDFEATLKQSESTNSPANLDSGSINLSMQDAQELARGIESLQNDSTNKQKQIEELQIWVDQLANRSEFFEFQYLSYYLVIYSKIALNILSSMGVIDKYVFINSIAVDQTVKDRVLEQNSIYSALYTNGLINEIQSKVNISDKGIRFLKHIQFIK